MIPDWQRDFLLALIAATLMLHIYATWLEIKPPSSYKPAIWRDKMRGNVCYIWRDTIFCLPE